MKLSFRFAVLCFAAALELGFPLVAADQEHVITPAVERVSLFKNGYAVVQQSLDIPAPGTYRWDSVPLAVHGTFFTESDLDVEIRTALRETITPPAFSMGGDQTGRGEKKPMMLFHAKARAGKTSSKIQMTYLTRGAAWAPSYRAKLLDAKRLSLEQNVVLINEWMPIRDAEIVLVSGFPQIETAGVVSPLHPEQTLRGFLSQLRSPSSGSEDDVGGMMSQALGNSAQRHTLHFRSEANPEIPWATGEGPDIHYNSIGKRTLDLGESLSLTTGVAEAAYERVLSCDLSAPVFNRWRRHAESSADMHIAESEVFEVLKFANPLPFPMTTAPITVTDGPRFLGQSMTGWLGPGQPASVRITKAMNVSVTYYEDVDLSRKPDETEESPTDPHRISGFGGGAADTPPWGMGLYNNDSYMLIPVRGTLEITNGRNEAATMHLTSAAVGVLDPDKKRIAECDVLPKAQTLTPADRDWAPNGAALLQWEIILKPGEKKTLTLQTNRWVRGM